MKKNTSLFILSLLVASFAMGAGRILKKSFSDKEEPFVEKIRQSTLVVVLLEENEDYLAKLSKKGKDKTAATYSAGIKAYNDNMRAMVSKYLKISQDIVFKMPSEIEAMDANERDNYSYLLYDKSVDFNPRGALMFTFDFFNDNQKAVKKNIDAYQDFIQFECLDEKDGPGEYRKLDIFAPANKKHESSGMLQQNLIEIVPTQADAKICLRQLQQQFDEMVKYENATKDELKATRNEAEQKLSANYDTIKHKTLLICKQDIDNGLALATIKRCYPYSYKVVSKEEFDKAILDSNGTYCALIIAPFVKVPGVYGPVLATSVKYTHLIIDLGTGNTLYMGFSGHVMVGTAGMGGYQTITEKNLKQLTQDLQNPGK